MADNATESPGSPAASSEPRVAATSAGVFALIAAAANAWALLVVVFSLVGANSTLPQRLISASIFLAPALSAVLLFVGAVALFTRRRAGRWLIIIGAVPAIIFAVVEAIYFMMLMFSGHGDLANTLLVAAVLAITATVQILIPLLALILAARLGVGRPARCRRVGQSCFAS
ncbi:hypothetical protein [Nocardia sp. NPDC020380]|uniref:hypothetical protein n=1 Tax=Nocardia sp. NPDC020380 TaxID=3364309 RepID=UPI00379170B3